MLVGISNTIADIKCLQSFFTLGYTTYMVPITNIWLVLGVDYICVSHSNGHVFRSNTLPDCQVHYSRLVDRRSTTKSLVDETCIDEFYGRQFYKCRILFDLEYY